MEMVTIKPDANNADWLLCPVCDSKTRIKLRQDTILTHLPLFCPKCKQEILVNVHHMTTTIIKEPVA
jgi:competence CoiA-like predicted nuclease